MRTKRKPSHKISTNNIASRALLILGSLALLTQLNSLVALAQDQTDELGSGQIQLSPKNGGGGGVSSVPSEEQVIKKSSAEQAAENAKINDFYPELLSLSDEPKIQISSIQPRQGPVTGMTRVTVRAGPLSKWEKIYQHPKCKFGDFDGSVVDATYVTCQENPYHFENKEARHKDRSFKCLECDGTPEVVSEGVQAVRVSLTGDFSDSLNSVNFQYYPKTLIHAFYPRYGPKDGATPVKVWGENFIDFGEDETRCSFGTRSVPAKVYNSTYLECRSPQSDVVEKPIPFTVSLNNQQNSRDTLMYYYYNWPAVEQLVPNRGPEQGGTVITVQGRNFFPFREMLDEINNANDTFCAFLDLKTRSPFVVTNSTRGECKAPASFYWHQSRVEITLNGVEYTEDENIFYYYKPPLLFDAEPRFGPKKGNTLVVLSGTNFEERAQIKCSFNDTEVAGKFVSASEIHCHSPPSLSIGYVDLKVAFEDDMWSTPVKYLYYDTPKVKALVPSCGPEEGYTQIAVHGEDFADLGRNKALCVFNHTIYTNATVMSSELIYCDSPSLLNEQGYSLSQAAASGVGQAGKQLNDEQKAPFYHIAVTIDGGNVVTKTDQIFVYYQHATVTNVTPNMGPLAGDTQIEVKAKGVLQPGALGPVKVRLGSIEYTPQITPEGNLIIKNEQVRYPGHTVVQVTLNGQQFTTEQIVHKRDPTSTFKYYQDPIVTAHAPLSGPSIGGTRVKIFGLGFQPNQSSSAQSESKLWLRYINAESGQTTAGPFQIDQTSIKNEELDFTTVSQPAGSKIIFQISLNGQNWIDVRGVGEQQSFVYYESPEIISISPSFASVKQKSKKMSITGSGFVCDTPPCSSVTVRFGTIPDNAIYVQGTIESEGLITCEIPMFTKPDVLPVEVSLNGFDYSRSNHTFGYFDPYVISAEPRLLAQDGSTEVTLKGLGFVDSGETKVRFDNAGHTLDCAGGCVKTGEFQDKNHIRGQSFAQADLKVHTSSSSTTEKPFNITEPLFMEVSVFSDDFTDNKIALYYFTDASYSSQFTSEAPANIPSEIMIDTSILAKDLNNVRAFSNPKARFTSADTSVTVDAVLVHMPLSQAYDGQDFLAPNTLLFHTPIWSLRDGQTSQTVKLDLSINGFNFKGNYDFTFTQKLVLDRTVPMAAPMTKSSNTLLIGQGFRPQNSKSNYSVKWGVLDTEQMPRSSIHDYAYDYTTYVQTVDGAQEIQAYISEASNFARIDTRMSEAFPYTDIYRSSTTLVEHNPHTLQWSQSQTSENQSTTTSDRRFLTAARPISSQNGGGYQAAQTGGPWYVEVGRDVRVPISSTVGFKANQTETSEFTYWDYVPSNVEFYQYREPTLVSKQPQNGVAQGGTIVQVSGFDFRYMPEYGLVPHCRFGEKIVRAVYDSPVRLVCTAPANQDAIGTPIPFEVSLNGVDWTSTGQTFTYFVQPEIFSSSPDAGPASGGTEIFIKGKNFPRIENPSQFNCRFTPTSTTTNAKLMTPKIMGATWLNETMIMCTSPGGWSQGDQMKLQVTFNGIDYDNLGLHFLLYKIDQVMPRSGPSNGAGIEFVTIMGQGFKADLKPLCMVNDTISEPISVSWTEIKCALPKVPEGDEFFGNVNLGVAANGQTWTNFEGGFQYYPQPEVFDIFPRNGPAIGLGVINFYGKGFRADFAQAKLACKIGESYGTAIFVSDTQMRCVVEDIETVAEGEKLAAVASLNSHSWSTPNDDEGETGSTYFIPYSISAITPQQGPTLGGTDVIIHGSGFVELESDDRPRCRFGTPSDYMIVEAEILSYHRMICRTPENVPLTKPTILPADIPFSVALSSDSFDPWTETSHKFRFYKQPIISKVEPEKVQIGQITELVLTIDPEEQTSAENVFVQPLPNNMRMGDFNDDESVGSMMGSMAQIKCNFGRFGETSGFYIDKYHMKCATPAVADSPEDIYQEEIELLVTFNGFDYEETAEVPLYFLFEGTGAPMGLLPVVLLILAIGALIFACIVFAQQYYLYRQTGSMSQAPAGGSNWMDNVRRMGQNIYSGSNSQNNSRQNQANNVGPYAQHADQVDNDNF